MRPFVTGLLFCAAASSANAVELKAATAVYTVERDGKAIGDATYSLAPAGPNTWTLTSVTRGTAGMARLLGLDVREESTFRWQNDRAEGMRYDYKQDAAIKHKQRHIDFDWGTKQAQVRDNGKSISYAVPANTIDRSTVAVVLGEMLAAGNHDMSLPVATQDHFEQQTFQAHGEEKIQVPAGSFTAIKVERTDVAGKARSWYAPDITKLPLRVEQLQHDGSTIVMELKQR